MYKATIKVRLGCNNCVVLGPTDSRDEAARLARAWLEANPTKPGDLPRGSVDIQHIEDESKE